MHINRLAVVVKAKQPFVDWINTFPKEPGKTWPTYTLAQVNEECLVLLIPEFPSNEEARKQIRRIKMDIFEQELESRRVKLSSKTNPES